MVTYLIWQDHMKGNLEIGVHGKHLRFCEKCMQTQTWINSMYMVTPHIHYLMV